MATEIERRFLLQSLPEPWLEQADAKAIRQGYLLIEDGRVLRIRQKGERYIMTVKSGRGLCRQEEEKDISADLFEMLWPLTENRRNMKVRYSRDIDGLCYELDVFEEDLAPLIILEVEFASAEAAHAFEPPAFAGREVTEDERYNNACLALYGIPEDGRG